MKAFIEVDGRTVEADFSECILYVSGEFAGNLDFSVKFSDSVPTKKVLNNLRVRLPKNESLIDVLGYGEIADGLEVTIQSELSPPGEDVPANVVPPSVEVFWLEKDRDLPIGQLRVNTRADDEEPGGAGSMPEGGAGCGATVFAILALLTCILYAAAAPSQDNYPVLVTKTNEQLEKPGKIIFQDDFESPAERQLLFRWSDNQ